jgi:hypothetical protein
MHAQGEERNQPHSNFVLETGLCHYFGSISHHGVSLSLIFCYFPFSMTITGLYFTIFYMPILVARKKPVSTQRILNFQMPSIHQSFHLFCILVKS